ncbi:hypothetical protein COO60DRAFT_215798 [Scenedesmus sp. NREL 46B-D3]|nr:hypothetical protein COO60DRAFT_215798 [Scenedesmus sp. NREL 46B-D3]
MKHSADTSASTAAGSRARHSKRLDSNNSSGAVDAAIAANQGAARAGAGALHAARQLAPEGSAAAAAAAAAAGDAAVGGADNQQQQQQPSPAAMLPSAGELQQHMEESAPAPAPDAALTPAAAAAAAGPAPEPAAAHQRQQQQGVEPLPIAASSAAAGSLTAAGDSSSSSSQTKQPTVGYKAPSELTAAPSKGKVSIAGRRLATGEVVDADVITLADYSAPGGGSSTSSSSSQPPGSSCCWGWQW